VRYDSYLCDGLVHMAGYTRADFWTMKMVGLSVDVLNSGKHLCIVMLVDSQGLLGRSSVIIARPCPVRVLCQLLQYRHAVNNDIAMHECLAKRGATSEIIQSLLY
jgi:hypothetical protein